ncbi:MAG: type II toxin-antitoxin system RelE/ParE family toxin, partial [Deltaproteobacteria bacterium]|nr:type II toxin-antitoxin system RelE/ParE family toxin [Deltaproteobacteria bacterium]
NSKKLSGGGSRWRVRTGDYRILYEIDDPRKIVKVYRIAHRKEAYR